MMGSRRTGWGAERTASYILNLFSLRSLLFKKFCRRRVTQWAATPLHLIPKFLFILSKKPASFNLLTRVLRLLMLRPILHAS